MFTAHNVVLYCTYSTTPLYYYTGVVLYCTHYSLLLLKACLHYCTWCGLSPPSRESLTSMFSPGFVSMVWPALLLLLQSLVYVHCQTAPYITFMGKTLADHDYVDISQVGNMMNGSDSVQCRTDLSTCCSDDQGSHRGDWYFPNGTRLPIPGGRPPIVEFRQAQRVDLRHNSGTEPTGIYRCDIATDAVHDNGMRETIYVGLYTSTGGITILSWKDKVFLYPFIAGDISIPDDVQLTMTPDLRQFTLTCISTGGPATTVTWTRDSTNVTGGTKTVLGDPVTSQYTHTLTVTGRTLGIYTCTVSNNKPSSKSKNLRVEGKNKILILHIPILFLQRLHVPQT